MKIESIKARCAPIVYIMLQRTCSTKRPMRNDQITHYLEHRGTNTGLVRGQRQNLRATSTLVFYQIQQVQLKIQLDQRVTGSNKQTRSCSFSFEIWY